MIPGKDIKPPFPGAIERSADLSLFWTAVIGAIVNDLEWLCLLVVLVLDVYALPKVRRKLRILILAFIPTSFTI